MTFPNLRQLAFFILWMGFVPGCASFALEKPRTFNERAAYALASVTALRVAATNALATKTISANDAENVQTLANHARASIDAARAAQALGNATDAVARLALAEGILADLRTYLATKRVKTP